jgi:hypothetical protein
VPADAGGDRFLGGGKFLPFSPWRGLKLVGCLYRVDLLGQLGTDWPFLFF